jgi:hypothetical protein
MGIFAYLKDDELIFVIFLQQQFLLILQCIACKIGKIMKIIIIIVLTKENA